MYKKFYFFILTAFFTPKIEAQFHEIGIFLGGSNYIGDVGSHRYLDPNELAYGFLYRWNITDRYSLRGGITLTTLNENEFKNTLENKCLLLKLAISSACLFIELSFAINAFKNNAKEDLPVP